MCDKDFKQFLSAALLKQLHRDNYITAEEASQLTSVKLFTPPDTVKSVARTTNANTSNTNSTLTSAMLDQRGQFQHISMGECLLSFNVEAPYANGSSSNGPATSTGVQYAMQSLHSTNAVDVIENLSDDVLQHASSESEHCSTPDASLSAHNQQSTTTEGSYIA